MGPGARPGGLVGSTVRLRFPCSWAFFFVFLRLRYFLSLLPVTPGASEYRLFGSWAVSLGCVSTLHLGGSAFCVWPYVRSDLCLYSLVLFWHLVKLA